MNYNYISIKNANGDYSYQTVPEDVYTYITQLEHCIRYPNTSKLKELYPERFNTDG